MDLRNSLRQLVFIRTLGVEEEFFRNRNGGDSDENVDEMRRKELGDGLEKLADSRQTGDEQQVVGEFWRPRRRIQNNSEQQRDDL